MQLEIEVAAAISEKLASRGWSRLDVDEPQFDLHVVPEVVFGLSLNMAVREYGVTLYPALGAGPSGASGLYSRFRGLPESLVASIGTGLADLLFRAGYGAAPVNRWLIESSSTVDSVGDTFCRDLEVYGMPYFRSLSTVGDIIAALEASRKSPTDVAHLAIAYASEGVVDKASGALRTYLQMSNDKGPRIAASSREFVRSFVTFFGIEDADLLDSITTD
jgi:hypothetical protein